jgi:hypothetical protein
VPETATQNNGVLPIWLHTNIVVSYLIIVLDKPLNYTIWPLGTEFKTLFSHELKFSKKYIAVWLLWK